MTPALRLFLAATLSVAALAAGWFGGAQPDSLAGREAGGPVTIPQLADAASVNRDVVRIAAAGLFPDADVARGSQGIANTSTPSLTDVEAALADPSLAALVREAGEWTIMLFGSNGGVMLLREGDELQQGWTVASISGASVRLEREAETREISAFPMTDN